MAKEANMTRSPFKTGMLFVVGGAVFAGFGQVAIQNDCAIERDSNFGTLDVHLLRVPLAHGFQVDAFGGNNTIGRAVLLVFFQILVFFCVVVQNLDFSADVGRIALRRGADA